MTSNRMLVQLVFVAQKCGVILRYIQNSPYYNRLLLISIHALAYKNSAVRKWLQMVFGEFVCVYATIITECLSEYERISDNGICT